jgi:hypothetical protein
MKRGYGILTAEALGVHPSTVSRNKERPDVVQKSIILEKLNDLNKNDIQPNSLNGGNDAER